MLCTVSVLLPVPNFSAIVRGFVCKRLNFIFPHNRVSDSEICLKLSELEIPQKSPLGQWMQEMVRHSRDLSEIMI